MLSAEREKLILEYLEQHGLVSFQDLEAQLRASAATIRRDLTRLTEAGLIARVRGGAKLAKPPKRGAHSKERPPVALHGVPFNENIHINRRQKELVGREAAKLCAAGSAVMIDGGSTTFQMCGHLSALKLTVLTNSLHIVNALLGQAGTRVLIPAGQVFPEQNIVLAADGDDGMPRFHAPKLFMGAAALGPAGLMQPDIILVTAERRLIERANEIVVLVDSSKFDGPSGHIVCPLEEIDVVVTDAGISAEHAKMLDRAGVKLIVARE